MTQFPKTTERQPQMQEAKDGVLEQRFKHMDTSQANCWKTA